ncbi:MAG: PEP-CTERM sorting domain-containing protein, partial [Planctomycetes bacterium]|nr:PEP-CTERM sorting domain-containing protein [Planctomycetota bacterium]
LFVGYDGNGTLNVEAEGQVRNTYCYLGFDSGSTGTATVTGAGSKWTNSGALYVGYNGNGTLSVEAGGQVSNTDGYLGSYSGSAGAATVTGTGSKWTNSGVLYVGLYRNGALKVEAGGQVSNTDGYLGYSSGSTGTATVTGAGSKWTNSGVLYVGVSGKGTLNVEAGGQVSNTTGYLGYKSGSTGTVTVDGSGSVWNNSGALYVGGSITSAGGAGSLTVRNGGQVTVGGTLKLWKADSAVTVNGGTMTVGVLAGTTGAVRTTDGPGGAALTVGSAESGSFSGTMRDDTGPGSLLKVGSGVLTLGGVNSYTGATTIAAGTLKLAATSTMASSLFDVRAGASLDVRDFLGGYTLPPGAALKGGGTVLGGVAASGTVAPGSSAGVLTVDDFTFAAGSILEIEIGGTARGTQYDVLAAGGTITLQSGSGLSVAFIGEYAPALGDTFHVMDFAALGGEFSTLSLPALGGGLAWDASALYATGTLGVVPEPATAAMVLAGLAFAALRRGYVRNWPLP